MVDRNRLPQQSAAGVEELGLKNLSEEQLFQNIIDAGSAWSDEQRGMVTASYDLAKTWHEDDRHRGMPYPYHLLRNANRAVGYLHITDPEIITAIILHDSVEDHPDAILAIHSSDTNEQSLHLPDDPVEQRELALARIATLFSPRVAEIVEGMTNPLPDEGEQLSYEEKLQRYVDHVTQAIEDPAVWVAKIVDWGDNGLGIVHSDFEPDSKQTTHFMRKYGLLIPVFQARFYRPDIQTMLDPSAKAYVEQMFSLAQERLLVEDDPSLPA